MGKRLKHQKRGKGLPRYKAPSSRFKVDLQYREYDDIEKTGMLKAQIVDFIDDPGRNAVVAKLAYENGEEGYMLAPEGVAIGDFIEVGAQAKLNIGNILPLYRIPEGAFIFNIELVPGDKGKLVRSPGSYATVVARDEKYVYVKLPSRKMISLSPECRAQLGVVSGGGRLDRPLMKAGKAYFKYKARNKLWPKTRGVHMSAYNHPHGGKQHHEGKPTTVKRGSPSGAKVGHIAARSTGRKKSLKTMEKVNK